jgi:hypothetical protein
MIKGNADVATSAKAATGEPSVSNPPAHSHSHCKVAWLSDNQDSYNKFTSILSTHHC